MATAVTVKAASAAKIQSHFFLVVLLFERDFIFAPYETGDGYSSACFKTPAAFENSQRLQEMD
jgi:hypothetical protein